MNLEEAREQLLRQIELQMCRIFESGSDAPKKLQEFYDYTEALPINHMVFEWYMNNQGNVQIKYQDSEIQICRLGAGDCAENFDAGSIKRDAYDLLIDLVFSNLN